MTQRPDDSAVHAGWTLLSTTVTSRPPDTNSTNDLDMVVQIEIPSDVAFVALVRTVAVAAANSVGALSGDRLDDLRWVMSEAVTNAIEANLNAGQTVASNAELTDSGRVLITCDVSDCQVLLQVADVGPGLKGPLSVPEITHPDRLMIEGGFGVPLIEQFSELVTFDADASGTTVTIRLDQHQ